MKNYLNWFTNEESGQGMVEYGLIVGLISIALIVVLGKAKTGLNDIFEKIASTLKSAAAVK